MFGAHLGDQPLPERDRLRVRVVDAEDRDALADPVANNVEQRLPQPSPVVAAEVDVVDVLVALRRVLGELQCPVGAAEEPLRVLGQPRVVGRALDREVERDLDADAPALRQRARESPRAVPRSGWIASCPPSSRADRPRAADVARLRPLGVVAALAVRHADRMDRREVEDVEAELGEARQLFAHALEPAPRAREELVPRAEAGERPVDRDVVRRRLRLLRAVARGCGERFVDRQLAALEENRALRELAREVGLPRGDLALQLGLERGDAVDPRLDSEAPASRPVDLERAGPEVVPLRHERRLGPARRAGPAVANRRAERLVAVAEDPRRHGDALAGRAFHGPAAAVDLRRDVLDLDPRGRVFGRGTPEVSPMREDRSVRLARSAGVLLHPTSLPSGRIDSDAYRFVDWLAAAGQSWWQMLPLGPPDEFDSPYRSPSAFAASPALLAKPDAPRHRRRDRGLRRAASVLDGHVGELRRRGRDRRPGALRAGVASVARLRRRARRASHRRRADLRLRRRRRLRRLAGAVRARRGRRRAARRAQQIGPALGEPAVRLARAPRDRLPLVARALPAHVRARRPMPRRPLPRLRLVLGDPRAPQDREARPLAARAGHRAVPRGRARARRPAGDRGGPRPHHAARLPAARRARPAGHGGSPLGVRRLAAQPPPAGEPRPSTRSSTRARTTPTRSRATSAAARLRGT